ncbi:MAG: hypothetical protein IIZ93_03610, partial [Acidaminococcaceae bacterium]|nr:hypothetical protein [Acidaminococcaceae bacterium]
TPHFCTTEIKYERSRRMIAQNGGMQKEHHTGNGTGEAAHGSERKTSWPGRATADADASESRPARQKRRKIP